MGVRVKLIGLNSAAHYNGTEGTISEWDAKNERWKVQLEFDGSRKALKNANLIIIGGELKSGQPGAA